MADRDKDYELIDHTADIGIRIRNKALKGLFENAAFALFDNLADLKKVEEALCEVIHVKGLDLPELMVNWLNQLLFLWETRLVIFKRFDVHEMSHTMLKAEVWGERYKTDRHDLLADIKAATYHNLRIEQHQGIWSAEIILDI